jgi:hypothetical protein
LDKSADEMTPLQDKAAEAHYLLGEFCRECRKEAKRVLDLDDLRYLESDLWEMLGGMIQALRKKVRTKRGRRFGI